VAAAAQGHLLDGGEVVLAVGVGQAEGDVGVGVAEDMRHAEVIAPDPHVVGGRPGQQGFEVGGRGLGEPVEGDVAGEGEDGDEEQTAEREAEPFEGAHDG